MHRDSKQFVLGICNQCSLCAKLLSILLNHIHQQHHPAITSPVQQSPPRSLQQEDLAHRKMEEKQKKMKEKKQVTSGTKVSYEKVVKDEGSDTEVQSAACIQQCSVDKQNGQDELVIATKTLTIHQGAHCSMERAEFKSLQLQDKQNNPSPSESSTDKRFHPSSSSDDDHKKTSRDDVDDHIQQCKQVGRDKLVIAAAASSDNWYSDDNTHTIVCRYCREEVNSCYYEDHLVSCLESYQCGQGDKVIDNRVRHSQTTRGYISPELVTTKDGISEFIVNCTATEESFNQLSIA